MSETESLAGKFFKADLNSNLTDFRYYYLKKRIKDDIYIFDSFDTGFKKNNIPININTTEKVYEDLMKDLEITAEEYSDALEIFKSQISKLWEIHRKTLVEKA